MLPSVFLGRHIYHPSVHIVRTDALEISGETERLFLLTVKIQAPRRQDNRGSKGPARHPPAAYHPDRPARLQKTRTIPYSHKSQ